MCKRKTVSKRGKWWYLASYGFFGGFLYGGLPDGDNIFGPFDSFGEAKKDALEYFKTDIDTARTAILEIRKCRKTDQKQVEGA
jgi:hypothetical protein